jgi:hypothetical protein
VPTINYFQERLVMMLKNLLCALLLTTSLALHAEEAKKEDAPPPPVFQQAGYIFVAPSLGIAKPVGDASMPLRFAYGLDVNYAVSSWFAVGVFGSRNNGPVETDSNIDLGITRVGAVLTVNPTYDSFFDVKAGVSFIDIKAKFDGLTVKGSTDSDPIFVSPGAGMILPIMPRLQFLPSLHYSHFFKTDDTDKFNVFDVMGAFRYQF